MEEKHSKKANNEGGTMHGKDNEAVRGIRDASPGKRQISQKGGSKPKKQRTAEITIEDNGIEAEWEAFLKQRATKKKAAVSDPRGNDVDDSMVMFGGIIPEGQTDKLEGEATEAKCKPLPTTQYSNVKIEDNGIARPKTIKESRGGDDRWKLKHLGAQDVQDLFTNAVVPRARKKAGSLEPWANLSTVDIKAIVDEVFGAGIHEVVENSPWVGLVNARLHNWRNSFAQVAMDTIDMLIKEHKDELNTKELIAEQVAACLQKEPIRPGSQLYMYAYQWGDWGNETGKHEGFALNALVLRTFALAHITSIDGIDDLMQEKPIGALILAMQAVGRALEHWKDGEKSAKKPLPFSGENYADTWVASNEKAGPHGKIVKKRVRRATVFVQTLKDLTESYWDTIITEAHSYIPKLKRKSRDRASSSTVVDKEEEDPDADFKLVTTLD